MHTKCIVLDLLQYRLSAVLVFQGGSKEIIFIPSISCSGIVEQGGCCYSDSYSKKLGCFWWCCHDLAILLCCVMIQEKMLCAVYSMRVLILYGSTEKRSAVPMLGGVGWDTGVVSLLQFYRCISWLLCLHAVLLIVELSWSWGVLWLISELFNLCKLICVTALAHYWHHQNNCIMDLRMQESSSPVRTHPPFLAECLSPVTFLCPSCPVQQGPNQTVF